MRARPVEERAAANLLGPLTIASNRVRAACTTHPRLMQTRALRQTKTLQNSVQKDANRALPQSLSRFLLQNLE
jgi:hypothetical protein